MEQSIILKCQNAAKQIRRDIIEMTYSVGNMGAHLGGSLSMSEILSALYFGVLQYKPEDPDFPERDRVILSKGHAALAFYPALVQAGILDREELSSFKKNGSKLSGHPSLNGLAGVEFASGSLGQGLSLGVGVCLALKYKKNTKSRVFVILGDGECDEGSIWEAAASASHYQLNQLTAVIDMNDIQYDGYTKEVMDMGSLAEKWQDFGWEVKEVNGHDIGELIEAYQTKTEKPLAVIAHTVKGKGVSFMENDCHYHNARLSKEQYQTAMEELGGAL